TTVYGHQHIYLARADDRNRRSSRADRARGPHQAADHVENPGDDRVQRGHRASSEVFLVRSSRVSPNWTETVVSFGRSSTDRSRWRSVDTGEEVRAATMASTCSAGMTARSSSSSSSRVAP